MKIYIESVILNNFLINLLILYLCFIVLKKRCNIIRLLLSDTIGTSFSVIYPFLDIKYIAILKITISIVMVVIVLKNLILKDIFKMIFTFYIITFFIGGTVIGINYLLTKKITFQISNSLLPFFLSLSSIFVIIVIRYILCLITKERIKNYEVDVLIENCGKSCNVQGLIDSGNRLYYKGNIPVSVLSDKIISSLEMKEEDEICIKTANGSSKMKVFFADKVTILDKEKSMQNSNVAVIASNNLDKYKIILSCELC